MRNPRGGTQTSNLRDIKYQVPKNRSLNPRSDERVPAPTDRVVAASWVAAYQQAVPPDRVAAVSWVAADERAVPPGRVAPTE